MINKTIAILSFILFTFLSVYSKPIKIGRDKTLVKDGPGNYYKTLTVLKIGTSVNYIKDSTEDPGWAEINYNKTKGYISKMALRSIDPNAKDKFKDIDFSNLDKKSRQEISPASYTAAIKGFVINYSKKKQLKDIDFNKLMAITEFKQSDVLKIRNETKLSYFPLDGELIGVKDAFINQNMRAIGIAASYDILQSDIVFDVNMTKKLNVIVNILNRQTYDYDVKYRVWIINDKEPVAYSGPGGYMFISSRLLEMLTDYRELVAILAHEVAHIAMRHGILDLTLEQARYSADQAINELDEMLSDDELKISEDLDTVVEQARNACAIVRDDKEEYEADDIALELLKRYKIDGKYLIEALKKMNLAIMDEHEGYKAQTEKRIKRLSKKINN
jgi:hypothetical protein